MTNLFADRDPERYAKTVKALTQVGGAANVAWCWVWWCAAPAADVALLPATPSMPSLTLHLLMDLASDSRSGPTCVSC